MESQISLASSSGPVNLSNIHINNSFSEFSLISKSGFNSIYKAKRYGQWYVLKGLSPDNLQDPIYIGLLEKEFFISVQLNDANIVRAYSFENVAGVGSCIVMEYVDGVTLDKYLLSAPSHSERLRIANQILSAMEYYHSIQIVHRDLKPKNILITRNGNNVKIIDFGLSDTDSFAVFKQPAGSAKYMAPEQYDTSVAIDLRADIYSVGIIMKELLPPGYSSVIKRCTCKDREDRYRTAAEVKNAIANQKKRRQYIVRAVAALAVVSAIIIGNLFLVKSLTREDGLTGVHHVDTVLYKGVFPGAMVVRDTVVVEKVIPLRVDTVVKIREVVPPEYEEFVNNERNRMKRDKLVNGLTEEMLEFIDKEWEKYSDEVDKTSPEYIYGSFLMSTIKCQEILISLFDRIIENKFTNDEYTYVLNYIIDKSTHYRGENPSYRKEDYLISKMVNDSLNSVSARYGDVIGDKVKQLMKAQRSR